MDERAFHESLTIVDGHCDSILDAVGQSWTDGAAPPRDLTLRSAQGHLDIPRLLEGGVSGQVMALFTSQKIVERATAHSHMLLDELEKLCSRDRRMAIGTKVADLDRAKAEKRICAFIGIEGGDALGGSLDELRVFYARGVRLMTLLWSRSNALGRGTGTPGSGGLTDFGRAVVAEMERLGMVVDVSHCADETLEDVLAVATRPIVASHSNSRVLCPHERNLTDEYAARIAATGGLVALTFAGLFVDQDPAKVSLERFIDHIEHLLAIVGPDHLGLGSDFDGFGERSGIVLKDCSFLPDLTAGMLRRGIPAATVAAIMGGTWRRVLGQIIG
jgi:membrane dipeptidase